MSDILSPKREGDLRRYLDEGSGASPTERDLARRLLDAHALAVAAAKGPPSTIYFCGVYPERGAKHDRGHYARLPGGGRVWIERVNGVENSPWGADGTFSRDPLIDGAVIQTMSGKQDAYARREEPEGVRYHFQKNDWTLVSWWDRSADPRGGCIAAFAMKGLYDPDEAETYARKMFPTVFERMDLHLGRTQAGEVLRDRVVRSLAEAPQSVWEEIARLLRIEVP